MIQYAALEYQYNVAMLDCLVYWTVDANRGVLFLWRVFSRLTLAVCIRRIEALDNDRERLSMVW